SRGRHEVGGAGGVGPRLPAEVSLARGAAGGPLRPPPQIPGDRASDGRCLVELRLEAEPVSRLNSLKQRSFSRPLSTFYLLSCRGMTRMTLAYASRIVTRSTCFGGWW